MRRRPGRGLLRARRRPAASATHHRLRIVAQAGVVLVALAVVLLAGFFPRTVRSAPQQPQLRVSLISLPGLAGSGAEAAPTSLEPAPVPLTVVAPLVTAEELLVAADATESTLTALQAARNAATQEVDVDEEQGREEEQLPLFYRYVVLEGDTVGSIATRFGISSDYVLWNNIDIISDEDLLTIGEQLQIPSVAGIIHNVRIDQTLTEIAALYEADASEITAFAANGLANPDPLREGTTILVPGGRVVPPPAPAIRPAAETPAFVQRDEVSDLGFVWPVLDIITSYFRAVPPAGRRHQCPDRDADRGRRRGAGRLRRRRRVLLVRLPRRDQARRDVYDALRAPRQLRRRAGRVRGGRSDHRDRRPDRPFDRAAPALRGPPQRHLPEPAALLAVGACVLAAASAGRGPSEPVETSYALDASSSTMRCCSPSWRGRRLSFGCGSSALRPEASRNARSAVCSPPGLRSGVAHGDRDHRLQIADRARRGRRVGRLLAVDRDDQDVDVAEQLGILGARRGAAAAEVGDVEVIRLQQEGRVALRPVAVLRRQRAGEAEELHTLNLVLARAIDHDRLSAHARRVVMVGVVAADRHDVGRRAPHVEARRLVRRVHDHGGLSRADAHAGVSQPGDVHVVAPPSGSRCPLIVSGAASSRQR